MTDRGRRTWGAGTDGSEDYAPRPTPAVLEPPPQRQIHVPRHVRSRLPRGFEAPVFEPQDQRRRGFPADVSFAHDVFQPPRGGNVRVFRVVHAAPRAQEPRTRRADVDLGPAAPGFDEPAALAAPLPVRPSTPARPALAHERLGKELHTAELDARVERDRV